MAGSDGGTLQGRNRVSLHFRAVSSAPEQTDVAALFARLKEEVRGTGRRLRDDPTKTQVRLSVRDQAERLWPVSAERPLTSSSAVKGGVLRPVKLLLRRLMRWYVEPLAADQRAFNDAVLKLIDDLSERLDRSLEAVRALEERVEKLEPK